MSLALVSGCASVTVSDRRNDDDPLTTIVRTHLPGEIVTTGDAINYYLEGTGYKLTTEPPAPKESTELVKQKAIYKGSDGVMMINEAITRMFDHEIALIVDHENKLVSVGHVKN